MKLLKNIGKKYEKYYKTIIILEYNSRDNN